MVEYKDKTCIYDYVTNRSFDAFISMRNKKSSLIQVNNQSISSYKNTIYENF